MDKFAKISLLDCLYALITMYRQSIYNVTIAY